MLVIDIETIPTLWPRVLIVLLLLVIDAMDLAIIKVAKLLGSSTSSINMMSPHAHWRCISNPALLA